VRLGKHNSADEPGKSGPKQKSTDPDLT